MEKCVKNQAVLTQVNPNFLNFPQEIMDLAQELTDGEKSIIQDLLMAEYHSLWALKSKIKYPAPMPELTKSAYREQADSLVNPRVKALLFNLDANMRSIIGHMQTLDQAGKDELIDAIKACYHHSAKRAITTETTNGKYKKPEGSKSAHTEL